VGLALALTAALGVAGVTIAIRQLGRTESTPTMVLWFTAFSMLLAGPLLPFFAEAHDSREWAILIVLGLCGGLGQLLLTASLRHAPVPVVAPFDYVQLLWAVTLGWLLWDTHPAATTWIGASIIVVSGLFTIYREHRLGRARPRPEPL
jgi:drug/metabolite transporter (DMT)-like permease